MLLAVRAHQRPMGSLAKSARRFRLLAPTRLIPLFLRTTATRESAAYRNLQPIAVLGDNRFTTAYFCQAAGATDGTEAVNRHVQRLISSGPTYSLAPPTHPPLLSVP